MKTTVQSLQRRLIALGFPLPKFGADGDPGAETLVALGAALDEIERVRGRKPSGLPPKPVPSATASITSTVILKQPKATRAIDEIIVHCTATPEGRDVSVDTIRSWHL